jgi:hypothetical protein
LDAKVIGGVVVPTGDDPREVMEPREEAFGLPRPPNAARPAAVLGAVAPCCLARRDHLDAVALTEERVDEGFTEIELPAVPKVFSGPAILIAFTDPWVYEIGCQTG